MNETIRAYLQRRIRWLMAIAIGGCLVFPLSAGVWHGTQPLLADLGVVLLSGAILGVNFLVKCPKCSANLGRTIAMPLAFNWGSGRRVNFCPFCGVSLDEPPYP